MKLQKKAVSIATKTKRKPKNWQLAKLPATRR